MAMKKRLVAGVGVATLWAAPTWAQEARRPAATEPAVFVTRHSGSFGGQRIEYTATAGETIVRAGDGQPTAAIFNVAYTRDGVAEPASRPVTFLYNGGPGSASLWLHMGAFGPRVVAFPDEPADDGAPPYRVQDNPETILDVTDLVFVDPVGTGFSRPLGEKRAKDFFGIGEDARSIASFIATWVEENGRWNSPKYLVGESYGATRTGALTKQLLDRHVGLSGVVLISGILDYQNNRFTPGNVMSHVSFLPSYAATAWYHNRLPTRPDDLEAFLEEVRDFARNEYATALIAGNRLEPAARRDVIARLHAYTGLSNEYLDGSDMRVPAWRFQ